MEAISLVVKDLIYFFIGGLALATILGFVYVSFQISRIRKRMEEDHKKDKKVQYTKGGIKKAPDVYTWAETLEYLEDFNKIRNVYSIFEQFIPVFPLLGILGTVAGLIQELNDISQMKDALATSMYTTFWGLIAAILLRIIDSIIVSNSVNKMELYFDTFEQNYEMTREEREQFGEDSE